MGFYNRDGYTYEGIEYFIEFAYELNDEDFLIVCRNMEEELNKKFVDNYLDTDLRAGFKKCEAETPEDLEYYQEEEDTTMSERICELRSDVIGWAMSGGKEQTALIAAIECETHLRKQILKDWDDMEETKQVEWRRVEGFE